MTTPASRWLIAAVLAGGMFTPNAPAQPVPPTTINGVYNGGYDGAQGTTKFKLSLTLSNMFLTGVFTFYPPDGSGTNAYTCDLVGPYNSESRQFQLRSIKWETVPPNRANVVAMSGTFDPDGGQGAGQISGKMLARPGPAYEAVRDAAESANMASVIAAQKAAGPAAASVARSREPTAATVVAPPPSSPASSASAPRRDFDSATAINGVYTGTYGRVHGNVGFKVSLKSTDRGELTGYFTFDLPPDLGGRAAYKLTGRNTWGVKHFALTATPLGTPAPHDFSFAQLNGGYNAYYGTLGGRVDASEDSFFTGMRDNAASASLDSVMDAQSLPATNRPVVIQPPSPAELAHAAAARAAMLAAAVPAQLASKNLVRKSRAYWEAYRTDLIREVFDGGFGSDVDDDTQFRILFNTYVEMFSKNCRAYLPAQHETVTVTQLTVQTDGHGNVISQAQGQSIAVEVDSRFAKYYRKYGESLTSSQQGLAAAAGVMSGRVSANAYSDPALDIVKFFATETCQSAAMRQLGENLLRGATGERSLQDTGGTITGAEAETDKNLPPGRFTRFVDGCNAWYRDPANGSYRTGHDTVFCECLGEKYQNAMNPDEEYYYANDFGRRFRNQIMQPKEVCTDPAWPQLHSAVDDCRQ